MIGEETLLTLLSILILGLIIPELLKKFRLPFITLIILAGSIFGPYGLNYVQSDDTIQFFGFLGMTFLMLMAGLETDLSKLTQSKSKILTISAVNGLLPFITGLFITKYFGYPWTTSLLIGIIFISSSVAIIIPSLKSNKFINHDVAQLMLASILVTDIVSLVLLGIFFQEASRITSLPLPLYFIILFASIPALLYLVPKISNYALRKKLSQDEGYEKKLRFVLVMIIGTLIYFILLGVHPILGAFLAGLSLSTIIMNDKSGILYAKLHTLGYGLFVPVFFFIVGIELNLSLFKEFDVKNLLMISIILGSIISKIVSGYLAGRIVKFSKKDSLIFGSISITQLTTTLAVTYAASSLGLLSSALVTSIILLAVISTFLGPLLASYMSKKLS